LLKFKTLVVALSFSKLAMHWQALEIAKKEQFDAVFDGATDYMDMYPDQNEEISGNLLRDLYGQHRIDYRQPLFKKNLEVEDNLYRVGITTDPRVRGTTEDRQVYYVEQVLLAHFLNYYITLHGWQSYVDNMRRLYVEKVQYISKQIS